MKDDDRKLSFAWNLLDKGEYEKGLAVYLSLPQSVNRYNGMVRAMVELGKLEEARKVLDSALKKYPDSYSLWVAMGNLHLALENYSEALECLHKAILLSPDHNSAALYAMSLALEKLGRFQDAILVLDSLIKKHPKDALFLIERGHCAVEMRDPQDALTFYQKARNIWDNSGNIQEGIALFSGLASAYIDLNLHREALEAAIDGLKTLHGGHPALFYNLGRVLWNMGIPDAAKEILRQGLKKFPDDTDLLELIKEIENDTDSPSPSGGTEFIFSLVLAALIARKRNPKR